MKFYRTQNLSYYDHFFQEDEIEQLAEVSEEH